MGIDHDGDSPQRHEGTKFQKAARGGYFVRRLGRRLEQQPRRRGQRLGQQLADLPVHESRGGEGGFGKETCRPMAS